MGAIDIVLKLLDLVIAGSMTYERAQQLISQVKAMKAENREPTDEEWAALLADTDDLSARLDVADHKLND